jgi:Na+-transporting methylmalonyl-CoA/oxaloacetate decarboxylase gamma subunit
MNIVDAIFITISSMLIVFIALSIIALIVSSFKHIFKNNESLKANNETLEIKKDEDISEEEKIVVALAASIMAGDGKVNPNLHIRSIKRIG